MLKNDFPIFAHKQVYLDSAASAQKPQCVLQAMDDFYRHFYANVHRGTCEIAQKATEIYEQSRATVAQFIHTTPENVIFTRSATGGLNLLARCWERLLKPGDEILVSVAEHHANFVPWQQLALRTGATFKVFDVCDNGDLDTDDFERQLSPQTRLVALGQMSNVLGRFNTLEPMIAAAHRVGAAVVVDASQSVAHAPLDVGQLGCDFLVFSGHKLYGPTGIGVLYAPHAIMDKFSPYEYGGDMVDEVALDKTIFAKSPARFEAGTPPFVQAYGLSKAIEYITTIGFDKIRQAEKLLMTDLIAQMQQRPWICPLGDWGGDRSLISFYIGDIHPQDMVFFLAHYGICVRAGHHCAMPIHTRFGIKGSLRVSLGLYNDSEDIKALIQALDKSYHLLGGHHAR